MSFSEEEVKPQSLDPEGERGKKETPWSWVEIHTAPLINAEGGVGPGYFKITHLT